MGMAARPISCQPEMVEASTDRSEEEYNGRFLALPHLATFGYYVYAKYGFDAPSLLRSSRSSPRDSETLDAPPTLGRDGCGAKVLEKKWVLDENDDLLACVGERFLDARRCQLLEASSTTFHVERDLSISLCGVPVTARRNVCSTQACVREPFLFALARSERPDWKPQVKVRENLMSDDSRTPRTGLSGYFKGISQRIQTQVSVMSPVIVHSGEMGDNDHQWFAELLRQYLPQRIGVDTGFVVNCDSDKGVGGDSLQQTLALVIRDYSFPARKVTSSCWTCSTTPHSALRRPFESVRWK